MALRSQGGLQRRGVRIPPAQNKKPLLPSGVDIAAALVSRTPAATADESDMPAISAGLTVTRKAVASRTTLFFAGTLDASAAPLMRDQAFTEIGTRPHCLCLDLTGAGLPDSTATDALVTIGNVARMMRVPFCVRVSPAFARLLEDTGLLRFVPLDTAGDPEGICL